MPAAAVVLAAGASQRMASLGKPKQLIQIENEFLIDRAIRLATEAGCVPVIAVLGAQSETIKAQANLLAQITVNTAWEEGIASSIRAGVVAAKKLAPRPDALMIMTCDQPAVTTHHLRALLTAANAGVIAASVYSGQAGIPAVFPHLYFEELMMLQGDTGAKALLKKHAAAVCGIPLEGGDLDLDTPEDLARI
jgi:CTP:molybdopterin cytidylyltransferase MocA